MLRRRFPVPCPGDFHGLDQRTLDSCLADARAAMGKAVQTATGKEAGSGERVAAPIDADLVRAAMAREAGERS